MTTTHPRALDLAERLRAIVEIAPRADALELHGTWCTWGALATCRELVARHLRDVGAGDGARVGIVMRNRPGVVGGVIGALSSRLSIVALSHLRPGAQLAEEIRTLDLAAVIADTEDWDRPSFVDAVRVAGMLGLAVDTYDPATVTVATPGNLAGGAVERRRSPGVAVAMLTSGTTGPPKRVPITYDNLAASFSGAAHYESRADGRPRLRSGVATLVAPILHTSGLFRLLLNVLEGRRVAMLEKFDVDGLLRLVRAYDARVLALTPTSIQMILDAEVDPAELAGVRAVISGTAPLDPAVAERFERLYGVAVLVMYGATEFAGGIAGWTMRDREAHRETKRGSVGRVHPGVEVRVRVPGTDRLAEPGAAGQLDVRAKQLAADDPEGWVATTDLARVDDDGFLWILGRTDDAIIRGGFKVSAGKVAEVLKRHPAVRDAAVVGLPDRRLGHVPVAAVELAANAVLDVAELTGWARDHLAPYEVPTTVVAVTALPRTPSLKVSQERLTEMLIHDHRVDPGHGR